MSERASSWFSSLRLQYLLAYACATGADWLQGPHVYALYESYGLKTKDISSLFVAGFGSSLALGTVVASYGDKIGRKKICLLYGILYGASCLTKHSSDYWILFVGRILAGIATSILLTSFEAWLVSEAHNKKGLEENYLTTVLTQAQQINGVAAILAGGIAQVAASHFGFVAPFDLAIFFLIATTVIVGKTWSEPPSSQTTDTSFFQNGWRVLFEDRDVLLLGLIQGLFEGSMYIFILEWTPMLSQKDNPTDPTPNIPHGYIFSGFMTSVFVGSSIFGLLTKKIASLETILLSVIAISAASFFVVIFFPPNFWRNFGALLVFEACIGIFWPCIGSLRARMLPDGCRSTLMNFFRIPVNVVIIVVLLQDYPLLTNFLACAVMLVIAVVLQTLIVLRRRPAHASVHYLHEPLLSVPEEQI
ncbi:putative Molybdate-anion transporter [Hypsibius exemplaris]|uniref:Molybdate-anion transporter n=1 Tax=Hypsibius exemplaris TaxID=2072580 RepID=A0A1W0WI33_HYPEX|nr:putative Molybdate-anion transporter [Hypsibius exemplaris]